MSSRSTARKRRHQQTSDLPPASKHAAAPSASESASSSTVLVEGIPSGCSVLELKSRLEMYGPISRTRIEGATGLVTFRSRDSALAAAAAAVDPLGGVVVRSESVRLV